MFDLVQFNSLLPQEQVGKHRKHVLAIAYCGAVRLTSTRSNRIETTPLFETYHYLKPMLEGVSNSGDAHSPI
jgi:hypothetical protein